MPSRLRHLSFIVAVGIQAVLLAMLPSSAYKVREVGVTVFLTKVPDAQMAAKKKEEDAADEPLPWEKDRK